MSTADVQIPSILISFIFRGCCEICGTSDTRALYSQRFTDPPVWNFLDHYYQGRIEKTFFDDTPYQITKCNRCGFVWQSYILSDQWMGMLYEDWISAEQSLNKKRHADISLVSGYARQVELIAHLIGKPPFETSVLDFGMGWGYWCSMAKAYSFNVSGFEVSARRIEYACKNGITVISSLEELCEKQFDFINAEQVFEHIPNPKNILYQLVGSMNRRGVIRISVPESRGLEKALAMKGWNESMEAIKPLEHINCYTHRTLILLAKEVGLDLIAQPHQLGQGLLGKSYGKNARNWATSLVGKYYRQYFGTTLYFRKSN